MKICFEKRSGDLISTRQNNRIQYKVSIIILNRSKSLLLIYSCSAFINYVIEGGQRSVHH